MNGVSVQVPSWFQRLSNLPVPARRAFVRVRRWSHFGRRAHPRIDFDVVDGIAVITLDDGKVNAIGPPMAKLFSDAFARVQSDDSIRAVVISGRPGQFSAGFDLDVLMIGGQQRDKLVRETWQLFSRLFTLPMPLVAACTGNAVAAGAALLLTADRRVGPDGDFQIGFNEAAIGIPLPGVLLMLVRDRLREEFFDQATAGARMYSPQDALAAGFFHRIVAPGDVINTAISEARELVAGAAEDFRRDKEKRVGPIAERMNDQLEKDMDLIEQIGS